VTTEISTVSLGRGSAVPVGMLPPMGLRSINELAGELGYGEIGPDWNKEPSVLRRGLVEPRQQRQISESVQQAVEWRWRSLAPQLSGHLATVMLIVEEFSEPRGFISPAYVGRLRRTTSRVLRLARQ
jgi:hypothetical protein